MWQAIVDGAMPEFWPPRPSRFWGTLFKPFRRWYLHSYYGIAEVMVEGIERLKDRIGPGDGVLIAPNHSHDSDPHVLMEVSSRAHQRFYFMAAWQIFRPHWGLDGWCLQRLGAFSVDREGCDRRAVKQAVEILTTGNTLVVFPEGEVYRLNDRLTPLLEGVAFMALTAQRDLDKKAADNSPPLTSSPHSAPQGERVAKHGNSSAGSASSRIWIVPAAIRYKYVEDIRPQLEKAITQIESRMLSTARPGTELQKRIVRTGELALTIKEKEKLGRSRDQEGDLPSRIAFLIGELLQRNEKMHLKKSPSAETVPLRVKALRRHFLEIWTDEKSNPDALRGARDGLDDVQLVLQLYSYPGDYVTEKPSIERMAETIEKFEEDLTGFARPKGKRQARVLFGDPIDLKEAASSGRPRTVAADVTDRLEEQITKLMAGPREEGSGET
jgi:1-acyl-sn-glycerol-3-phosphate acyltransferase